MANRPPRVAWDSCVFIDCLQKSEGRIEHIEPLVRDAEAGKLNVVCSALAIAETIHVKNLGEDEERAAIAAFFRNDYVHICAADEAVAETARDIRRTANLSTEDAIHLATAIRMKCDALLTNDGEKQKSKRLLPLNGKHGIRICTPRQYNSDKFPLLNVTE